MALRILSPAGSTKSPHTFSRGNVARSRVATRTPRRASDQAMTDPAGPPPTTTTSKMPAAAMQNPRSGLTGYHKALLAQCLVELRLLWDRGCADVENDSRFTPARPRL